jgi:nucleoside-diphosphate-sugar epimerase
MKLFITGHNGFIGQHLVEKLSHHDIEFLSHDLRDHDKVAQQLKAVNPDTILHLAARTEVEQSFNEQIVFSEINYVGTVNLIEAAKHCTNLSRFVFASTMEVYGWQPISDDIKQGIFSGDLPAFDETTVPCPNAPYAVAKLACEKYLEYCQRTFGLPYTILRQTNSYGRIDNDFFVTECIISQMLRNPREIFLGDPRPYRNFIFIDDLADAWCAVIDNSNSKNKIYCLGPDNALMIGDYAKLIASKLSWNGVIHWYSKPPRPGEIFLLNSSHRLLSQDTGWRPKFNINQGIDCAIDRWRASNG